MFLMSNLKTYSRLLCRSDASFEALKLKLASVMPTHNSDVHPGDDSSHPASATQTVHRVSAPPPHLPSLLEDPARKSAGQDQALSGGSHSSQESENKRKDDR
jgi:hypothetical protein